MKKIDMIVDTQFGSTGKGLIAGYLAERRGYDTVVTANMPNAGHTFINAAGRKWVHKVLPNGIVSPGLKRVMIGPGAVFSPEQLVKEVKDSIDLLAGKDLVIHEGAALLLDRHRTQEQQTLNSISSTMQGSMAAMVEKMQRDPGRPILARHWANQLTEFIPEEVNVAVIPARTWARCLSFCHNVLAEGAQGYSLGINAGFWPYCTSRDCTPMRFMSDMALPRSHELRVVGTARTFPIRVGNTEGGTSGPGYPDQKEVTWEQIGQAEERTTVTNRVRRVFTFSIQQIEEACAVMEPDTLFLNFANYLQDREEVLDLCHKIYFHTGVPIQWLGWGPKASDVEAV